MGASRSQSSTTTLATRETTTTAVSSRVCSALDSSAKEAKTPARVTPADQSCSTTRLSAQLRGESAAPTPTTQASTPMSPCSETGSINNLNFTLLDFVLIQINTKKLK